MHDNAACHRSRETQRNLQRRGIRIIRWPRYSPDLNLIEHRWNWMKNYIQEKYWQAWNAVPDSYLDTLFST